MCLCSRRFHDNRLWIHKDFRAKWGWESGGGGDKHNYRDRQVVRNQSNQLKHLFILSPFLLLSRLKINKFNKKLLFSPCKINVMYFFLNFFPC